MKVSLTCLLAILACFLRSADIPLNGNWSVSLPPGTLEAQGIGATAQGPRNNPPNAGTQGDHGLLLERVMWKSSVSIDGVTLSTCDALSAPHLYTVPARLLTPGTHTLTVEVDNRQIINIGEDGHCYGDTMAPRHSPSVTRGSLRHMAARCRFPPTVGTSSMPRHPRNIVFILADGIGYGDLSCYDKIPNLTPFFDE